MLEHLRGEHDVDAGVGDGHGPVIADLQRGLGVAGQVGGQVLGVGGEQAAVRDVRAAVVEDGGARRHVERRGQPRELARQLGDDVAQAMPRRRRAQVGRAVGVEPWRRRGRHVPDSSAAFDRNPPPPRR